MHYRTTSRRANRGLTLIELLVVAAIIAMISVVTLANYNKYRSMSVVTSLAYNVAVGIREAQVYGLSFRQDPSAVFSSYGAHFDIGTTGSNTFFLLFADSDPVGAPDLMYSASTEQVKTYKMSNNYKIGSMCGYVTSASACDPLQTLDIAFTRPDPEASIIGASIALNGAGCASNCGNGKGGRGGLITTVYSYATITVNNPDSTLGRTIQVWSSGQISVK